MENLVFALVWKGTDSLACFGEPALYWDRAVAERTIQSWNQKNKSRAGSVEIRAGFLSNTGTLRFSGPAIALPMPTWCGQCHDSEPLCAA